jgi:hypothetical protein
MAMRNCSHCGGGHKDPLRLKGIAEILVYHGKTLVDHFVEKNIILYQGNGAVITTLASVGPTIPQVITRMAVGDQGTIPSDPTVPKVPTEGLTGLYHEFYREDIQDVLLTINPGSSFTVPATLISNNTTITVANTASIANGMSVVGTNIPAGCRVQNVSDSTHVILTAAPTVGGVENVTFSGAANQAKFTATFNAVDVPLTAFSDPSNPVINEVGLVIVNPLAAGGSTRAPVAAPNANQSDEIVMSLRTFKSVPFQIANDVSITIRYTIFME